MTAVPPGGTHPVPALPEPTVARLEALLCDADGNLFPSEEPAFVATADVTNRFLAALTGALERIDRFGARAAVAAALAAPARPLPR